MGVVNGIFGVELKNENFLIFGVVGDFLKCYVCWVISWAVLACEILEHLVHYQTHIKEYNYERRCCTC